MSIDRPVSKFIKGWFSSQYEITPPNFKLPINKLPSVPKDTTMLVITGFLECQLKNM